jgi:hypothetical protein
MCLLFNDACKGANKQEWKTDNGGHRYFDELRLIRKSANFKDDLENEYKRSGNYCPIKMQVFINKRMLNTFGILPYPQWENMQ